MRKYKVEIVLIAVLLILAIPFTQVVKHKLNMVHVR